MPEKLNWDYDQQLDCEVAEYRGFRIRAVRDESPENPLEMWASAWPMIVLNDRSFDTYGDSFPGEGVLNPFDRFTDHSLVLLQKHLAKLLAWDSTWVWQTDAQLIRENLAGWVNTGEDRTALTEIEALYELLDIPTYRTTSRGYSQGDWADLLVVATPEAVKAFGNQPENIAKSLEHQADLYGAWAWGDVYGYIVEQPVRSPDADEDDEPDWEEVPDGSCWGYYGVDHDESGLEESARAVIDGMLSRKEAA